MDQRLIFALPVVLSPLQFYISVIYYRTWSFVLEFIRIRSVKVEFVDVLQQAKHLFFMQVDNNPSKPERSQQGNGPPSVPQPLRAPRPLSGPLISRTRPPGRQTESRVFYGGFKVSDNTSSPRRPRSRSPAAGGPVRSVVGRKQAPNSLLSRQPPTAQIRSKADQSQIQALTPQASYLYTHSNLQAQVSPQGPTQKVPEQAAPEPEDGRGPFNLPFGRLYSFRGLRDKWMKPPTQSKRTSTSAPEKERKNTSQSRPISHPVSRLYVTETYKAHASRLNTTSICFIY